MSTIYHLGGCCAKEVPPKVFGNELLTAVLRGRGNPGEGGGEEEAGSISQTCLQTQATAGQQADTLSLPTHRFANATVCQRAM